jgi:hypothetical protein
MPAPISNTFVSLSTIEGVDCIGDSRTIINENITVLGNSLSGLNTTVENLNTSFNTNNVGPSATLTTQVNVLSVFNPAGTYLGFIPIYQ